MNIENKILFYTTPQEKVNISVRFVNETFWLTQKAMATLFGVEVPAISKHLKNIYFISTKSNQNAFKNR